jgi:glutamine synthetase
VEAAAIQDWLDRHHVEVVRTHATTLDGPGVGKYIRRSKFTKSLPMGHGICESALSMDLTGSPHLSHWHPQREDNLGDLLLKPDLETLVSDGIDPQVAHCICNFTSPDGEELRLCPRSTLQRVVAEVNDLGFRVRATCELEFYLFRASYVALRENEFRDLSLVGTIPHPTVYLIRNAYQATSFMREVTKRLGLKDIVWESWNEEAGVGQLELNLEPSDPVRMADNVVLTKQILYEVAVDQDMAVTFMAKPSKSLASGMHIHHSLTDSSANPLFHDPDSPDRRSSLLRNWLAGIMTTLPAAVSYLCPTINSYRRFADFSAAPITHTWGEDNRSVALRLITKSAEATRIEHRVGASDLNPYLAMAVIIAGGLAGLRNKLELPQEFRKIAWGLPDKYERLPDTISKAVNALRNDALLKEVMGEDIIDYWAKTRDSEWLAFHAQGGNLESRDISDWEYRRYFELI